MIEVIFKLKHCAFEYVVESQSLSMGHWFQFLTLALVSAPTLSSFLHRQTTAVWDYPSVVKTEWLDRNENCHGDHNCDLSWHASEGVCHSFPEWPPVKLCLYGIYLPYFTIDSLKVSLRVLYSCGLILLIFRVVILSAGSCGVEESIHSRIEGINCWTF